MNRRTFLRLATQAVVALSAAPLMRWLPEPPPAPLTAGEFFQQLYEQWLFTGEANIVVTGEWVTIAGIGQYVSVLR